MWVRVAFGAVLAVALVAGCGASEPVPAPVPVTVVSVDSWGAMTLSNGLRVFEVDGTEGAGSDRCRVEWLTGRARSVLVGVRIVGAQRETSSPYAVAPAGYSYGRLDYADGSGGVAANPWQTVRQRWSGEASSACAPPEPAPEVGPSVTSEPDAGSDVYVDSDDDHNGRDGALTGGYCARKWWC